MMARKVEVVSHDVVHQGFYPKSVIKLRHSLFDGGMSDLVQRDLFRIGRSVIVLPYDPRSDQVLLIEQFRPAALALGGDGWTIETTAGRVEDREDVEEAGRREALEEGGVTVSDLTFVASAMPSAGGVIERSTILIGRTDLSAAGGVFGMADENEDIKVHILPYQTAMAWLDDGRIDGLQLVTALYWLALHRAELRTRWA